MKKNKKNISKKIPIGTVIQTRDEYIYEGKPKPAGQYKTNDLYRQAVVVETNKYDQIGIVKFSSKGGYEVTYKNIKKKYKPFLEIFDEEGAVIVISPKFIRRKGFVSVGDVNKIKKNLYVSKKTPNGVKRSNRFKSRFLKGRNK